MSIRLRVRGPNGILNVGEQLTEESKLEELKIEIQTLTNINVEDQCLKINFPPTAITNPNNSTLIECGISDGDQILLTESKGFGQPISSSTKTENTQTSTSNPPKPEPLPHSTPAVTSTSNNNNNNSNNSNKMSEFAASFYASGNNTEPISVEPSSSSNNNISNSNSNNNSSSNNNGELSTKYYPSTSKGKAVETRDGILIIKEIPDDNSCLFNSVRYMR
ncbi:hypothetical protein PIROE2DRAFT_8655 [Piromyces sp. E2]|nr:hypothetical protein PIROE2DRAFT_8655 [Piromyces sp. E2]|eukprot:OUM64576.1 hypothetical protein PIROE2DRAFT_8655 [Piromyces sp. E2]